MAGEPTAPSGDPYAISKANLRDTVKWLGGIFGALAAAVVAGAPLSGLGALDHASLQFWLAAAALFAAFICICLALSVTLSVLRADFLYDADLDPDRPLGPRPDVNEIDAIRQDIAAHARDLFPQYNSYRMLLTDIEAADKNAQALWADWTADRQDAGVAQPEVDASKADYDTQVDELQKLRNLQSDIRYYATYLRFYGRLQRAQPRMFALGVGALFCLTFFAAASHKNEDAKSPQTIVVPVTVAASAPVPVPVDAAATRLGEVRFATGRAVVSSEGLAQIKRARDAAALHPDAVVLLMAHTDTVGGNVNRGLALRRATAVRSLLTGPGGLAAARVYSAELPKAALPEVTGDQVGEPSNRAVVMYLLPMPRASDKGAGPAGG